MTNVVLHSVSDLRETEETNPDHVQEIARLVLRAGLWTTPIAIELSSGAVMDGHHRLAAAKALGLTHIPAVSFTYDQVELRAWREGDHVSPEDVLRRASERNLYPPKTTRHIFPGAPATCLVPLSGLKADGFFEHMEWIWDGEEPPHVQVPGARYGCAAQVDFRSAA